MYYKIIKDGLDKEFIKLLLKGVQEAKIKNNQKISHVNTNLYFLNDLCRHISQDEFFYEIKRSLGNDLLNFLGVNKAILLNSFHAIREVENNYRHITGIHYDFQISNAIANACVDSAIRGATIWIPTKDITLNDAGLIIFDKSLSLREIHLAAGEDGYISNIPYVNVSDNNKRFTDNPIYKKYIRQEDKPHVVDILADFECAEGKFDNFLNLHKTCMQRIYSELKGKYYISEISLGDVILFNSECYHGTYLPDCRFLPRINFDMRAVVEFKNNNVRDNFKGLLIQKENF